MEKIFNLLSKKIFKYSKIKSIFLDTKLNEIDFCNLLSILCLKFMLTNNTSYNLCDVVMNNLYVFMLTNNKIGNSKFPEPAFSIYLAFDEGEYYHVNDSLGTNQKIMYTIPMLDEIKIKFDL